MFNLSSPYYAVVDLGSNSFHMLVAREIQGCIQILEKIKRKVRLAAGLDSHFILDNEAMERGWVCLALFSSRLQSIPPDHIRIVATAALRHAKNADVFLEKAQRILGFPIKVISGEEEAHIISQGVAYTTGGEGDFFAVDIGGASTEVIIADGFEPIALTSLNMGCVTWLERYFSDRVLNKSNFDNAVQSAKQILSRISKQYCDLGWSRCVGASGTVQALQSVMLCQGLDETITLKKLQRIRDQLIDCGHFDRLEINGLVYDRALVFPSGLSILIAIFETFDIDSMLLAGGALREGLLYSMIDTVKNQDVRQCTIKSIQSRFFVDIEQAENVKETLFFLLNQCNESWLPEIVSKMLLEAAARLHEIGLSVAFKQDTEHAAYLLHNLDLPGFTGAQKRLLAAWFRSYHGDFFPIEKGEAMSIKSANRGLRLLRLAIILCHCRDKKAIPPVKLKVDGDTMNLIFPEDYLKNNALMTEKCAAESFMLAENHWKLFCY